MKQKSLIQKWAPVLESEIGAPIKRYQDAAVIACLLETQTKLNKGYMAESVNVTSDVAVYQQYALPLIRRQFPELLAMNTVSVIPTTTPTGIYFALRYLYDNAPVKTSQFRNGQKRELGYDLEKDYTGTVVDTVGRKWTTSEGEFLSNFHQDGQSPVDLSLSTGASKIKTTSIKVIKGSV
jgi:hypothetical protein